MLDLSAVFKDKTGNIFTTTTAHLNAEGSRVVAERIAQVHPGTGHGLAAVKAEGR